MRTTAWILAAFTLLAWPWPARADIVNIVSDDSWTVADRQGNALGTAQHVCLSPMIPANCPPGAMVYGYPFGGGWGADLTSIPAAKWIWARSSRAGTTSTIDGSAPGAALSQFTFRKEVVLCGEPTAGSVFAASDDVAEVIVNGVYVLDTTTHVSLASASIPVSALRRGVNLIEVIGTNGVNPPGCEPAVYRCNPAGLVFAASIEDNCRAPPVKCTASDGSMVDVGSSEILACTGADEVGTRSRPCLDNGRWGDISSSCSCGTGVAAVCGNSGEAQIRCCPGGTSCGSRTLPPLPKPWWCPLVFSIPAVCNPVGLRTADWFCD